MTTFEALNVILVFLVPLILIPAVVQLTKFLVLRNQFNKYPAFKDMYVTCPKVLKTFKSEGKSGIILAIAFVVLTILCLVI